MIAMEKLQGAAVSEDTSTLLQQLEEALSSLHQRDARCQELSLQVNKFGAKNVFIFLIAVRSSGIVFVAPYSFKTVLSIKTG